MEELTKALELIRKTCIDNSNCGRCPLGNSFEECLIAKESPDEWNIEGEQVIRLLG